jgi:hypothetical protein
MAIFGPLYARVDVCWIRGAWVVTIFQDDQSEHRAFRSEVEARQYGAARLEEVRSETS